MNAAEDCLFSRIVRWKLKLAAGSRCELCNGRFPTSHLEIHTIQSDWNPGMPGDPQRAFLVLCRVCHRDLHACSLPLPDQRELLRHRPAAVKRTMRRILRYHPGKYTPPEYDLAEVYAQASYDYRWAG